MSSCSARATASLPTNFRRVEEAAAAKEWVGGLEALGGTDIDGALKEAMRMADRERSTVVLFLTDGLPTEGETNTAAILE